MKDELGWRLTYLRKVRQTWALLELRTGVELAAYMQVARGSVDNCRCGWSGKMCEQFGDELIEAGVWCGW